MSTETYTLCSGELSDGTYGLVLTNADDDEFLVELPLQIKIDARTDSHDVVAQVCESELWNLPDVVEHDGEFIHMIYGPKKLG